MKLKSNIFYNITFTDEFDMNTWCELYKVDRSIFDVLDCDDEGAYHATFSSDCVPVYHKEMVNKRKSEEEALNKYGKGRNGSPKKRTNGKFSNNAPKGRGQTANELFLLR